MSESPSLQWSNQNHYRVSFVMRRVLCLKLRSDLFWLLDWDAVTAMTLYEGSHLDKLLFEPRVCVHASCIELDLLGYLDGGDCMTLVWKWSPGLCTVTGLLKHFNICVFVWKKRLEQNTPTLNKPLYIDKRWFMNALC